MAINIQIYPNNKKELELISELFSTRSWLVHEQYGDP